MTYDATNTLETISLHLAMAFGQGTGTMLATSAALSAALAPYRNYLEQHTSIWDSAALTFISFARALGTLSAVRAAQQGSAVIDEPAVSWALQRIQVNTLAPLGNCGCLVASPPE